MKELIARVMEINTINTQGTLRTMAARGTPVPLDDLVSSSSNERWAVFAPVGKTPELVPLTEDILYDSSGDYWVSNEDTSIPLLAAARTEFGGQPDALYWIKRHGTLLAVKKTSQLALRVIALDTLMDKISVINAQRNKTHPARVVNKRLLRKPTKDDLGLYRAVVRIDFHEGVRVTRDIIESNRGLYEAYGKLAGFQTDVRIPVDVLQGMDEGIVGVTPGLGTYTEFHLDIIPASRFSRLRGYFGQLLHTAIDQTFHPYERIVELEEVNLHLRSAQEQIAHDRESLGLVQALRLVNHEFNTFLATLASTNANIVSAYQKILERISQLYVSSNDTSTFLPIAVEFAQHNIEHKSSPKPNDWEERIGDVAANYEFAHVDEFDVAYQLQAIAATVELAGRYFLLSHDWSKHEQRAGLDLIVAIGSIGQDLQAHERSTCLARELIDVMKVYTQGGTEDYKCTNPLPGLDATIRVSSYRQEGVELLRSSAGSVELWCSPGRLNRAWTNVLVNMYRALESTKNAQISVTDQTVTDGQRSYLEVRFLNNGPCIPQEEQGKIWEGGYSLRGGSGLGLAIVSSIIKEHRGTYLLNSTEEQTEFIFTIPIRGEQNE